MRKQVALQEDLQGVKRDGERRDRAAMREPIAGSNRTHRDGSAVSSKIAGGEGDTELTKKERRQRA